LGYKENNLSLEKLQDLLSVNLVKQLDEILINGNYGDFVMNPESVDIITWLRSVNNDMHIHVSTNGGAGTKEFWTALAKLDIEISFCIDGLEDTHHIYRQDTNYEQIIKNATSYITAGGRAVWTMTEFEHNSHQFKQAEALSRQLGFASFNKRSTSRNNGPIYNRKGEKIYTMGAGTNFPDKIDEDWVNDYINRQGIESYLKDTKKHIVCDALNNKSIYISADGVINPCCFLGLYENYPGLTHGMSQKTTIELAVVSFDKIKKSFDNQQLTACQEFCSV
jgi:sulfatase maturation enzyme AslB (radical SAM superfamily)